MLTKIEIHQNKSLILIRIIALKFKHNYTVYSITFYSSVHIYFVGNSIKEDETIISYLTSPGTKTFEQKVNRCQNYKLGLSLVDSVTEKKKSEISDFPAPSLTRENVGSWLWRYYGANVLILIVFVPLPLILYRVVMHIFINRLNGLQGASLGEKCFFIFCMGKK